MLNQLLVEYRYIFAALLGLILFAIMDYAKFKAMAYQVMLLAKSKAKDMVLKSGQEQEDFVVEKLYDLMPVRFKVFISKETLRAIVKKLYSAAKDILDDGKLNNSI